MTALRSRSGRSSAHLLAGAALSAILAGALLTSGSASASGAAVPAPLIGADAPGVVAGQYLVMLKDGSTGPAAGRIVAAATERGEKAGATIRKRFAGVVNGYSAELDASELNKVRADPSVEYVQANRTYTTAGSTQKPVTWGLDRIDQRSRTQNNEYYFTDTGAGVKAYVVDTGILSSHPDFGGRVETGVNTVDGGDSEDCDGHGTHVAGTIGGGRYGVAKDVTLVPVRVLTCRGAGNTESLVAGLDWVIDDHQAGQPAVANLSLGTEDPGSDRALEDAVRETIADGISVTVAAGNSDANACEYSPADVSAAVTVGASNTRDERSVFSNYGSCVDIYAPGSAITSDWYQRTANGGYTIQTLSGTSMASPHVAGTIALYLQNHPTASPKTVSAALYAAATPKKVTKVSKASQGRLLFAVQPQSRPTTLTLSATKIMPGTSLLKGKKICSPSGKYCLTQRSSDGQLVLYRVAGKKTIWTDKVAGSWTKLNTSGNLASYNTYGRSVWSTGTSGVGASELRVRDRGYLALVVQASQKTVWHTKPAE